MRRIIFILLAVWLMVPLRSYAQFDEDKQYPHEYSQEDSHPLKGLSYILAPIGFALDWTVSRPLHYIATDSFVAPVFGEDPVYESSRPAPIAEIPPRDRFNNYAAAPSAPLREQNVAPPAGAQRRTQPLISPPPTSSPPPAADIGQPVLH
jgi:hypothetical protein